MARASVDLPQPLSPTRPRLSPAWSVKLTSRTARKAGAAAEQAATGAGVVAHQPLDLAAAARARAGAAASGRCAEAAKSARV